MSDSGGVVAFKKRNKNAANRRRAVSEDQSPSREESATPSVDEESDGSISNVEDLLAFRALRQQQRKLGIDLDKLHAGDERQRKKQKIAHQDAQEPQVGLRKVGAAGSKAEDEDPSQRNVIRTRDFTGQTNALDVDKHMVAYIETELAKRKGGGHVDVAKEVSQLDPEDELFRIAEKYSIAKEKDSGADGSITLSSAMLTSIPEVDLGIENRLKNIEDTEKAKRALFDAKEAAKSQKPSDDGGWAGARFFLPENRKQEVADIMALARAQAEQGDRPDEVPQIWIPHKAQEGQKQTATDAKVAARFKQREQDRKRK